MEFHALKRNNNVNRAGIPRHKANNSSVFGHLPFAVESYTYAVSNGDILYPVDQLKYLGVIVSLDLSWSPHINTISSRARSIAFWVLSVFKSRDRVTILTLYKSIVRSHLEYCCPLWHPTSKIADIQELESVQRISGLSSLNYWERLKSLKLTSLQRRYGVSVQMIPKLNSRII